MNRFDTVSNRFWYDPARFASFMNANLYAGKDIIQPDDLVPVDRRYDHYTRDVIMKWTTDKQEMYLAIENQLVEDLTMPYRNAMYDMKSYESQIRRLKRNHRETRDLEDPLETISRIKKEDRLIPCITFVIYYGQEEWKHHKSLKDMFGYKQINDANMLENRMNLVQICKDDPRRYKNRDIQMCIDIAQLMFQKDLETIKKRYRQKIDKEVVMMICALTGSRRLELIISKEEGDEIDMCKAIEEWEEEISKQARNEGRLESEKHGEKRSEKRGEKRGRKLGREEGKKDQILQFIQEMLEKGYTDEMILGFKSVTKQLLKQAKLGFVKKSV